MGTLRRSHRNVDGTFLSLRAVIRCTLPFVFFASDQIFAQVYQWRDAEGNVHFTDTPPEEGGALDKEIKLKPTTPPPSASSNESTSKSSKSSKAPAKKDPNDPNLNVNHVLEAIKYAVTLQATVHAQARQCAKTSPPGESYTEGMQKWSVQNQDILKKIDVIKTQVLLFNGINEMDGYFEKIDEQTQRSIDRQFANVPKAQRSADCTNALRDVQNGRLDIVNDRVRHDHIVNFFNWFTAGKR